MQSFIKALKYLTGYGYEDSVEKKFKYDCVYFLELFVFSTCTSFAIFSKYSLDHDNDVKIFSSAAALSSVLLVTQSCFRLAHYCSSECCSDIDDHTEQYKINNPGTAMSDFESTEAGHNNYSLFNDISM